MSTIGQLFWRGIVTVIAASGVLLTISWAVLAMVSSMGWSGRSDLQIALIIILLLLSPIALALMLTTRAIAAVNKDRRLASICLALGSLFCAPISWSLLALGLFAP